MNALGALIHCGVLSKKFLFDNSKFNRNHILFNKSFILCRYFALISGLELSKLMSMHLMINSFSVKHNWQHFCIFL